MSTVTPVTMTMTPHGMRAMAFDSSAVRKRISAEETMSAIMPTFCPKPATATISATMPAAVSQFCVVMGSAFSTSAASARAASRRNSFQPPSNRKPPKPTSACASAL